MKPILFNTEMVQAILDGRKTTTRRPVKNLAISDNGDGYFIAKEIHKGEITEYLNETFGGPYDFVAGNAVQYARYQKGDILYVRETYSDVEIVGHPETRKRYYRADDNYPDYIPWRPSIFMPREAARIFLKVTDVKAEQLHDITEEQIKQEGIEFVSGYDVRDIPLNTWDYFEMLFKRLWNSTIKKSDLPLYGWDANPWVWVISFERCEKPKEEA